jgi:hypothetical protein
MIESSEFPIFGDEDSKGTTGVGSARFNRLDKASSPVRGSGIYKIRGMDPLAQAEIEKLQPYHRGNGYKAHPLWLLHDLDRISKHRLLHVAVASFSGFLLDPAKIYNAKIGPGFIESLSGVVTTDTPVARMMLKPIIKNLEVRVDVQPPLKIAFAPVGGAQSTAVVETLADIYKFIDTEVLPKLNPFL